LKKVLKVCPINEQAINANYYHYFFLCKECHWCASSLNLEVSSRIIKCPGCKDAYIKLIPIFDNKSNKINYSEKSRFTTEFGIKYRHGNAIVA
jgi:hypothetical protein